MIRLMPRVPLFACVVSSFMYVTSPPTRALASDRTSAITESRRCIVHFRVARFRDFGLSHSYLAHSGLSCKKKR